MSLFFFSTAVVYCGYNLKGADYDCHMQELNARPADLEAGMLISSQTLLTAVVFFCSISQVIESFVFQYNQYKLNYKLKLFLNYR